MRRRPAQHPKPLLEQLESRQLMSVVTSVVAVPFINAAALPPVQMVTGAITLRRILPAQTRTMGPFAIVAGVLQSGAGAVNVTNTQSVTGVMHLSGGTLVTNRVTTGSGTVSSVNFNGGVVQLDHAPLSGMILTATNAVQNPTGSLYIAPPALSIVSASGQGASNGANVLTVGSGTLMITAVTTSNLDQNVTT
jgi:hypothetical protein